METKGNRSNDRQAPQTHDQHPAEWSEDLERDRMAGQNVGIHSADAESGLPTAYDVKEVHRALSDRFADDELRQIPVLREGQRLQQGATYVDLSAGEPKEFTASGAMAASGDHCYVPKDRVPYMLWNRLIGVESAARRNEGNDDPRSR